MILTFGKHKGKSINDLMNEGEFSYIVWLEENVNSVHIGRKIYETCKNIVLPQQVIDEVIIESEHGDWGCRD